jgi:transposase
MNMSNNGTKNRSEGTVRIKRKYDEEFKRSALKMIDNGQTVRSVAESLGVGENLLHKWKSARRSGASDLEKEVIELRAAKRQLELERDILKKALSIFSRQQ